MASFTDGHGRQHVVTITCDTVEEVRERLGLDLLSVIEDDSPLLKELSARPIRAVEILCVVLGIPSERGDPARKQFLSGLHGDCLEAACEALMRSLADFFRRGPREALHAILDKEKELHARASQAVIEEANSGLVEEALEALIQQHRQRARDQIDAVKESALATPGGSSGSWPASSASIPAP
jgi:hypothetical protein